MTAHNRIYKIKKNHVYFILFGWIVKICRAQIYFFNLKYLFCSYMEPAARSDSLTRLPSPLAAPVLLLPFLARVERKRRLLWWPVEGREATGLEYFRSYKYCPTQHFKSYYLRDTQGVVTAGANCSRWVCGLLILWQATTSATQTFYYAVQSTFY